MMAAFGNPKVREKFGLENQIRDLKSLRDSHEKEVGRARVEISRNRDKIRGLKESVKNWDEIAGILKKAFPDNKAADFALTEKGKMVRMDKDRFLQSIQDKIDELTERAKEIIGKGEFDIDAHFYKARQEVQELESIYANFRGEVNGVPFRFTLQPNTSSGRGEGKTHYLSLDGVGIKYSLRPKEYEDWHYYLERGVSTPGGVLHLFIALSLTRLACPRRSGTRSSRRRTT